MKKRLFDFIDSKVSSFLLSLCLCVSVCWSRKASTEWAWLQQERGKTIDQWVRQESKNQLRDLFLMWVLHECKPILCLPAKVLGSTMRKKWQLQQRHNRAHLISHSLWLELHVNWISFHSFLRLWSLNASSSYLFLVENFLEPKLASVSPGRVPMNKMAHSVWLQYFGFFSLWGLLFSSWRVSLLHVVKCL